MRDIKVIEEGTPTQVAHPWRSILRTVVASVVGIALAWVARTLGLDLTEYGPAVVDSVTVAIWAAGTALGQWLLTRPWLMPLLTVIGLGTGVDRESKGLDFVPVSVPPTVEDDLPDDLPGIIPDGAGRHRAES